MRILLFCILLMLFTGIWPAVALPQNPSPAFFPATLVSCKDEHNCDTTPQHLEQFVKDFYRWYLVSMDSTPLESWNELPGKTLEKSKDKDKEFKQLILMKSITPAFYAWLSTAFDEDGGRIQNRTYCSPDINFFTCSQDIFDDWLDTVSAQLIEVNSAYALLIVRFTTLRKDADEQTYPPHLIAVHLKPVDGFWRIAGTQMLSPME